MAIGPDSRSKIGVNAPLGGSAANEAKQSVSNSTQVSVAPAFGKQATTNARTGLSRVSPLVGDSTTANPVNTPARINFTVEPLKDVQAYVRQRKALVIQRLLNTRNCRAGAELQQKIQAAQPGKPIGIWTPLGNVDLPFVRYPTPDGLRFEPNAVVSMCQGAEKELANQLTDLESLIRQLEQAIRESA